MKRFTFAIIIALVLFPSCDKIKNLGLFGNKKAKKAMEDTRIARRQDSIRVADSLKKAQAELQAIEQARQNELRLADEAARASKYHIIVGSFYTPEYAKGWAEEYRSKGYNVQILKMKNSTFELVSAESFPTLSAAYNKLYNYQDNIMPDAWVYVAD